MTIVKHKFERKEGHARVEMFYYTLKGMHLGEYDAKYRSNAGNPEEMHPAIIRLNRSNGEFWVQWSTPKMRHLKAPTLPELRVLLKDYLDSVRTGKLIADMKNWTKVIFWGNHGPTAAMVLFDDEGRIVRAAPWDDNKKQYDPDQRLPYQYNHKRDRLIPYTKAQMQKQQRLYNTWHAFDVQTLRLANARRRFDWDDDNKVHQTVMREAAPYIKRWADRLEKENARILKAKAKKKECP